MDKQRAYRALQETARKRGVSVEEVIAEIDKAIAQAMKNCENDNNTNAMNIWKMIPCEGEVPTAVEVVAFFGGALS